ERPDTVRRRARPLELERYLPQRLCRVHLSCLTSAARVRAPVFPQPVPSRELLLLRPVLPLCSARDRNGRAQASSFRTPLVNSFSGQIFIVGLPECLVVGGRIVSGPLRRQDRQLPVPQGARCPDAVGWAGRPGRLYAAGRHW